MAENLFKDHSTTAIEACIAKALADLVGSEVKVHIGELKFSSASTVLDRGVAFTVTANLPFKGWDFAEEIAAKKS